MSSKINLQTCEYACKSSIFQDNQLIYHKTQEYSNKIQIDTDACIKCGKCALVCPMNNLSLSKCKIVANGRCTLCYRCVNQCSEKAITILGKQVIFQYSVYDFHWKPFPFRSFPFRRLCRFALPPRRGIRERIGRECVKRLDDILYFYPQKWRSIA